MEGFLLETPTPCAPGPCQDAFLPPPLRSTEKSHLAIHQALFRPHWRSRRAPLTGCSGRTAWGLVELQVVVT